MKSAGGRLDEIRENVINNYAAKSIDEVRDKLAHAALYAERHRM
jgi:hypothetical protein